MAAINSVSQSERCMLKILEIQRAHQMLKRHLTVNREEYEWESGGYKLRRYNNTAKREEKQTWTWIEQNIHWPVN